MADEGIGLLEKKQRGGEERVVAGAAGEKAFIARCTILRVLNSFAGVIPRIGNGPPEYTARYSGNPLEKFTLP